jgi:hypothetical protein
MKNEDFLDELFEKARNEKDFIPPGDVLDKGMKPGKSSGMDILKRNLGKIVVGTVALLALLGVGIQTILKDKASKEQVELTSNGDDNSSAYNSNDKLPNDSSSLSSSGSTSGNSHSDSISGNIDNTSEITRDHSFTGTDPTGNVNDPGKTKNFSDNPYKNTPPSIRGDIDKLLLMQQTPMQEYEINCSLDTILVARQGSKFHIESFCFRNNNGRVISGNVRVQIKECYSPNSFVRENLSTYSDSGELLETGGMYYLNVIQGLDTLSIRKGFEVGITPNYNVPERMNLYYGQRDIVNTMQWEPDPLGKTEAPLFVSIGGKYGRVMNSYFHKNYKLHKADMIALKDTHWTSHFTSDQRKVLGSTNCGLYDGLLVNACEEFTNISYKMALSDTFNVNSRLTSFNFECMNKNKYAYYHQTMNYDTFRRYDPESDYRYVDIPLFFSINTGWLNLDCVPMISLKFRKAGVKPKHDVVINIPAGMRVNANLYLPQQGSMARSVNPESGKLIFKSIPGEQTGILILNSFLNDTFYVFRKEINTDNFAGIKVKFEHILDLDEYLSWLEKAASTKPVDPNIIVEDPGG